MKRGAAEWYILTGNMEWYAFLLLLIQSISCLPWWSEGYLERASWDMKDKLGWITLKYEPAGYVVQLQFDNECKVKDKYEYFNCAKLHMYSYMMQP